MAVKVRCMTLREVLARYGITTLREFCSRTGFTRQHAWNLMNGWTGVVSRPCNFFTANSRFPSRS
jgi:predicted DNA-binding transcriptional regulator AlpA